MENKPRNLRNIVNEVRAPGYFARARERSQGRKSPWNLLLIFLGIGAMAGFTYVLFQIMWRIHTMIYPDHTGRLDEFWTTGLSLPSFVSSFLLAMPLVFASMPLGFMLTNYILWSIPPARRALDREAESVEWASFRDSMRGLWVIARIVVPISLLLSFIGAATLRNLR